jgi:hypothetical protein
MKQERKKAPKPLNHETAYIQRRQLNYVVVGACLELHVVCYYRSRT